MVTMTDEEQMWRKRALPMIDMSNLEYSKLRNVASSALVIRLRETLTELDKERAEISQLIEEGEQFQPGSEALR